MIVIGISGVARAGKDTLCNFLVEKFKEKNLVAKRYALADLLKEKMSFLIKGEFGINIFNCSDEEKLLIRPLMVAFGSAKRKQSSGKFWTDSLLQKIAKDSGSVHVAIITDIRYAEYPEDELVWLKQKLNGVLIHVEKFVEVGGEKIPVLPPNEDEMRNDPVIRQQAHFNLQWEDKSIPNSNADISAQNLFNHLCLALKI